MKTRRLFSKLIRLVPLLLLFAIVVLALWPATPSGNVGEEETFQAVKSRILELHRDCENNKIRRLVFTEEEINTYLGELIVRHLDETGTQSTIDLDEINVDVDRTSIKVFTAMNLGLAKVTYILGGRPVVEQGQFEFVVDRVVAGHLPLPGPAANLVTDGVMGVFSQLDVERFILDHLSELDLSDGRIRVTTRGP